MAGNSKDKGRSVAGKVVAIMRAFTHNDELSTTQIARLTGLPVSTAHRLLGELVVGGMLQRTTQGQFRVGPDLQAIAANLPRAASVGSRVRAAEPRRRLMGEEDRSA
jgi:DNA-binding IclR family transcriptional regulator